MVRTHIILNPASSGGRTGRRRQHILRVLEGCLGREFSLCVTRRPLEATESARAAIEDGSELIIAAGGDGTIQEVVNGFFSNGQPLNPSCTLGIISSGTGHGLAQSLALPPDFERQVDIVCSGRTRLMDVGKISFLGDNGKVAGRYFVNECQIGIGAAVVRGVQSRQKRLGGLLAFGLGTFLQALLYRENLLTMSLDGALEITQSLVGVVVANGSHTAGGMNLAPRAHLDDGVLDVLLIHEQSITERVRNFPRIYSGRHVESEKFSYYQAEEISIGSAESVFVAADGEFLGSTPCQIQVLAKALRFKSVG